MPYLYGEESKDPACGYSGLNGGCSKCGRHDDIEKHHVFPRRNQGSDERWNLAALCVVCHEEWESWETLHSGNWKTEMDFHLNFVEWLDIPPLSILAAAYLDRASWDQVDALWHRCMVKPRIGPLEC